METQVDKENTEKLKEWMDGATENKIRIYYEMEDGVHLIEIDTEIEI